MLYFWYSFYTWTYYIPSTEHIATFVKQWRYPDLIYQKIGETTTKKQNKKKMCWENKQELTTSFVKMSSSTMNLLTDLNASVTLNQQTQKQRMSQPSAPALKPNPR